MPWLGAGLAYAHRRGNLKVPERLISEVKGGIGVRRSGWRTAGHRLEKIAVRPIDKMGGEPRGLGKLGNAADDAQIAVEEQVGFHALSSHGELVRRPGVFEMKRRRTGGQDHVRAEWEPRVQPLLEHGGENLLELSDGLGAAKVRSAGRAENLGAARIYLDAMLDFLQTLDGFHNRGRECSHKVLEVSFPVELNCATERGQVAGEGRVVERARLIE